MTKESKGGFWYDVSKGLKYLGETISQWFDNKPPPPNDFNVHNGIPGLGGAAGFSGVGPD
jgi:hypothetical protein